MTWLTVNWRTVLKGIGILSLLAVLWWYFWHNPETLKKQQDQINELKQQVANTVASTKLLAQIEVDHGKISKESFSNISTILHTPVPRVIVTGGLPFVPAVSKANTSH